MVELTQLSDTMKAKLEAKEHELSEMIAIAQDQLEKKAKEAESLKETIKHLEEAAATKERERQQKKQRKIEEKLKKGNVVDEEELQWRDRFKLLSDRFADLHEENEKLKGVS